MPKFNYIAMDAQGKETKGSLDAKNQSEALARLQEMQLFPTKVVEAGAAASPAAKGKKGAKGKSGGAPGKGGKGGKGMKKEFNIPLHKVPGFGGVSSKVLCTFTRQLATLIDAGLPLLRGLRVLERQEKNPSLKETIQKISVSVEGGSTFSEALGQHPKIFNKLFVSMVKAGEMGGVLEVVLLRLAEFMEKAQKIKGKVVAAMFYPMAVLVVAVAIMAILMVVVIPKFKDIFSDLAGKDLPGFTVLVLNISATVQHHFLETCGALFVIFVIFRLLVKTKTGRLFFDKFKLVAPVFGPVISKVAISRFTRTLGTLVSSGVPILQSLNIVQETSGNVIVANAVHSVHENVKEGENITTPLESSKIFPPMVISMVDVGEQTGALPEMLMKIADNYDEEVDNAVAAMTSLLEPVMIVFLAVIVGSIVIAMFMPLISLMDGIDNTSSEE